MDSEPGVVVLGSNTSEVRTSTSCNLCLLNAFKYASSNIANYGNDFGSDMKSIRLGNVTMNASSSKQKVTLLSHSDIPITASNFQRFQTLFLVIVDFYDAVILSHTRTHDIFARIVSRECDGMKHIKDGIVNHPLVSRWNLDDHGLRRTASILADGFAKISCISPSAGRAW